MKKTAIILGISVLSGFSLLAQDAFDAVKMSSYDIKGSARYMSMGGAFVSLGGDASAIQDNPAALGVYRSSEIALSLNYDYTRSNSQWNGNSSFGILDNFTANQTNIVLNISPYGKTKGLVSYSFGFGYNRVKNFNRILSAESGTEVNTSLTDNMSAYANGNSNPLVSDAFSEDNDPYNNADIGWLSILGYDAGLMSYDTTRISTNNPWVSTLSGGETVKPSQKLVERGYIDQYNFAWGGNINNRYYIGIGINLLDAEYSLSSVYGETFSATRGGQFSLDNYLRTSGLGFNANFGFIANPVNFLRIGASFQTPTVWNFTDLSNGNLNNRHQTPDWVQDYRLHTPLKVNAGASFLFGKLGLVSLEYEYNNIRGTQLLSNIGDSQSYSLPNQDMREMFNDMHRIKLGAEFWVMKNLALRAGYVYQTSTTKDDACRYMLINSTRTDTYYSIMGDAHYASAGIGYRNSFFFADLAYQYRVINESIYPYENLSGGTLNPILAQTERHSAVFSFGFKF